LVGVLAGMAHAQTTIVGHTLEEAIKAGAWGFSKPPDVVKPWKHGGQELIWTWWDKARGWECGIGLKVDAHGIIRDRDQKASCRKSKRKWYPVVPLRM